ncbi:DNA excision repair protein ERCC-1 isoform X3 [Cryptomeria japonica]|uniref:DNA excision repair protein ERCC-1 isoform X3 n=1 Tax=Cryptomeria japonica TaxID=3369 RepID=UPI0027DA2CE0|nr:DNA excision repair protein ERCC-1 isoform X3 [Cryptomeria japonica]
MGTEKDQQQQELRNFLVRVPSHEEVSEKSGAQPLPSLFRPSSEPPASFTQAFSFVKNSEFYTPPPPPPPSSSNEASSSAGASLNSSLKAIQFLSILGMFGGHLQISYQIMCLVKMHVLCISVCATIYFIQIIFTIGYAKYKRALSYGLFYAMLMCVTVFCSNQEDVIKPLHEVTRTALLHDCTLLCGWSVEECARYLETIKTYENKPADNILERTDNDYLSRLSSALTTVRRVNKNDVVSLGSAFGTLSGIIGASMEDLARCPGIGEHKASNDDPQSRRINYLADSHQKRSSQDKDDLLQSNIIKDNLLQSSFIKDDLLHLSSSPAFEGKHHQIEHQPSVRQGGIPVITPPVGLVHLSMFRFNIPDSLKMAQTSMYLPRLSIGRIFQRRRVQIMQLFHSSELSLL